MTEELLAAVIYVAAFARMEGANFRGCGAAVESTRAEPRVEGDDAGTSECEQAEPRPMTSEPLFRGVRRISPKPLAEDGSPIAEESCDHAVLVVSSEQQAVECTLLSNGRNLAVTECDIERAGP